MGDTRITERTDSIMSEQNPNQTPPAESKPNSEQTPPAFDYDKLG